MTVWDTGCVFMISTGWDALTHLQQCSNEADAPRTSLQHRYRHILEKKDHKTAHLRFWGDPSSLDNSHVSAKPTPPPSPAAGFIPDK